MLVISSVIIVLLLILIVASAEDSEEYLVKVDTHFALKANTPSVTPTRQPTSPTLSPTGVRYDAWALLATDGLPPRGQHSSCFSSTGTMNLIYVIAGTSTAGLLSDIWTFNVQSRKNFT